MASEKVEWSRKTGKLKELYDRMIKRHKLEKEVDADFVELLKDLPFHVSAKKNLGGANNLNEPDWFICVNGRFLVIETKRPPSTSKRKKVEIREGQRIRAKWWQRAGAKYVVCDSAERMVDAVRELYREQQELKERRTEDTY